MEFIPSPCFSVGMELELQLLDPATHDLTDAVLPLLATYTDHRWVKPEFIQNTVEVVSPPAADLTELSAGLGRLIGELLQHADRVGVGVCGGGTHPFHHRPAVFTPGPRYRRMEKASGWLGHNQVTFATHVHLGLPSGEEALTLMGELRPYLPLLIALSASSPFWHGQDTGFAAFRHRVLAASRTYGLPPEFGDWPSFQGFVATLQRAGLLRTVRDVHWDLRPCPHFGTLEVRVMDAQPSLGEALALAALLRALVRFLQRTRSGGESRRPLGSLPWWALKDNCYLASRDGIEARLIASLDGDPVPLRQIARDTLRLVRPCAESDEWPWLDRLAESIVSGLPYARQRRLFQRTGSLPAVVASLCRTFRSGLD